MEFYTSALLVFNTACIPYCLTDITQRYLIAKDYSRNNVNCISYLVFMISIVFAFYLSNTLATVSPFLLGILSMLAAIDTANIMGHYSTTEDVQKI